MVAAFVALALIGAACGEQGLQLPGCEVSVRNPTGATVLSVQAVPTARYTPCIHALPLGWDSVDFDAEDGLSRLELHRTGQNFLDVSVTETCDTRGATEVEGPADDIRRFERIEFATAHVAVTIIPSALRPLLWSQMIADDLFGEEIEDRPLVIQIDDRIEESVSSRVNLARLRGDYVWIVDELDAEEETFEMRGETPASSGTGLSVDAALDLIEDTVGDVFYRGQWFFTFPGGCMTYDFNATDQLARTVAADAEQAFGFYPAWELREIGEDLGFRIVP